MKKIIVVLASALVISLLGATMPLYAEETEQGNIQISLNDIHEYLWEINAEMSEEEITKLAFRNQKIINYLNYFFTEDSYKAYYSAVTHLKQKRDGAVEELIDATEGLEQTDSITERLIFLWDAGKMPQDPEENLTEEELDAMTIEGYGFEPYVIKFLIDDPAQAKGNIVVISGGSGDNATEGYPAVLRFNELGYNCFLLHRRCADYPSLDNYMDTQRAMRVVRNYAQQAELGGQDMIAVMGFSAGGKSILGMLDHCYGYLTPADEGAAGYVPDEIDAVCSDPDVAMLIYSATGNPIAEGNTNVPAIYLCVGDEDATKNYENTIKMYDVIKDTIPSELFVVEGAGHGFGVGQEGATKSVPDCALWPEQADVFMQKYPGYSHKNDEAAEETGDSIDLSLEQGSVTVSYYDGTEILQNEEGKDLQILVPHGIEIGRAHV